MNGASFSGTSAFAAAVQWLQGTLLGTIATVVAVIAVASVGILLLSGRIDVRRGGQVIFGCFILFGASTIAEGIMHQLNGAGDSSTINAASSPPPPALPPPPVYPPVQAQQGHAATPFDPYAGAALPTRR